MTSLPSSVAVVGPGRLGRVLTSALRLTDVDVYGPLGRGQTQEADLILLCVPDGALAGAAREHHGLSRMIGHLSGATPLASIAHDDVPALGMHPLQTFRGDDSPRRFHRVGCAVAGTTPESVAVATALASTLGMHPFHIAEADRPAYHAAACLASNYVLTVLAAAEQLAATAGIDPLQMRELFGPLVETGVANWRAVGPVEALTGPAARGDQVTLARHREVVAQRLPHLLELTDQLVGHTKSLIIDAEGSR